MLPPSAAAASEGGGGGVVLGADKSSVADAAGRLPCVAPCAAPDAGAVCAASAGFSPAPDPLPTQPHKKSNLGGQSSYIYYPLIYIMCVYIYICGGQSSYIYYVCIYHTPSDMPIVVQSTSSQLQRSAHLDNCVIDTLGETAHLRPCWGTRWSFRWSFPADGTPGNLSSIHGRQGQTVQRRGG